MGSSKRKKPGSSAGRGAKTTSRRNAILISISVGIIAGIPLGMLLQPFFLSILPTEVNEAELTITLSRDCKIVFNYTDEVLGLGKRTFDYEEYASENISSTMGITYGHFENPEIHLAFQELASPKNTIPEVKKELKEMGYREEDSDFYSSKYPRAMTYYQSGMLNLLSEDFVFPYIDIEESPPEVYFPSGSFIEDDLELSKNQYFVIDFLTLIMEIDYDIPGGLVEDEIIQIFSYFLFNVPEALYDEALEGNPLDYISLRKEAFVLEGENREIVIEELFFNIDQFDEIEPYSMDINIEGESETLRLLGGSFP